MTIFSMTATWICLNNLSLRTHADTNSCASLGLVDDVTHEKEKPHRFKFQVSRLKYHYCFLVLAF